MLPGGGRHLRAPLDHPSHFLLDKGTFDCLKTLKEVTVLWSLIVCVCVHSRALNYYLVHKKIRVVSCFLKLISFSESMFIRQDIVTGYQWAPFLQHSILIVYYCVPELTVKYFEKSSLHTRDSLLICKIRVGVSK